MMPDWHRSSAGPLIMGILNATPDSFSDGGIFSSVPAAVGRITEMIDAGADIIDIGGESTRPGSKPVSAEEEISRIEPILKEVMPSIDVPVSIDTMKPEVADMAIGYGVTMINDVNGLRDGRMSDIVAEYGVSVVIMHMYGIPATIGTDIMKEGYFGQVRCFLKRSVEAAIDAGINEKNILVDPGIGFGTSPDQDMALIKNCGLFSEKCPVVIGPSRKRFLSVFYPGMDRDEATVEISRLAAESGADILRVHNVSMVKSGLF